MTIWFVARNFFLWQEISSCGKKFLTVARNFLLWQDIFSLENIRLWHYFCMKIISLFPKESSSFFLWHKKMSSYYRNALVWQELFASFGRKYLRVKFMTKTRKFLPTFRVSLKISWEPGSLAPGEYPTLYMAYISVGEWLLKLLTHSTEVPHWPVGPLKSNHMNCTGNGKCTQEIE